MKTLDPNLEFILDRGIDTRIVMDKLILPPTLYSWDGISPGNLRNMIERVTDQVDIHATSEAGVTAAAADWDSSLAILGA